MKNIFKYSFIAIFAMMITTQSCTDNVVEVVTFDDNFNPDPPKKGKRETPPDVNLLDTYVYFKDIKADKKIVKKFTRGQIQVLNAENQEITLNLNKKAEENLTYQLVLDNDYIQEKGITVLPENTYSLAYDKAFNKGEISDKINVQFNENAIKGLKDGIYLLAFKSAFSNQEVKMLDGYERFISIIEIKTSRLPDGDNIDSNADVQVDGTYSNDDIVFTAKLNATNIGRLSDGKGEDRNSWKPTSEEVLTATLPETKTVAGIRITTSYFPGFDFFKYQSLKSFSIEVSDDNGETFVKQGDLVDATYNSEYVYVKFKEPIDVNKIRFSNFQNQDERDGRAPSIHEIEFIYQN